MWNTVIFYRLNVMQTVFGTNIEFSMRTFLFKTQGSSAEEQQQTISCNLHLDPAADVSTTEPDNCSCYSEEECSGKIEYISSSATWLSLIKILLQNLANTKSFSILLVNRKRVHLKFYQLSFGQPKCPKRYFWEHNSTRQIYLN